MGGGLQRALGSQPVSGGALTGSTGTGFGFGFARRFAHRLGLRFGTAFGHIGSGSVHSWFSTCAGVAAAAAAAVTVGADIGVRGDDVTVFLFRGSECRTLRQLHQSWAWTCSATQL